MRVRWLLFSLLFCVSSRAHALDYSDRSLLFTDAPFRPADAAGVSVLHALGAVEGYPDGSFKPNQTLNRAEFLKIVLLTDASIRISSSDSASCFPDVPADAWFSKYVCLALRRGIVQGYPDGMFHPEREVNYAEALKILGEIYDYTAFTQPDDAWYVMYVQAARNHGTELPVNIALDRALTRGQMARLAAAYRSESEGELEYYRRAEKGERVEVPSQEEEPTEEESESSSSSSSSSSSEASSSSSASSESEPESEPAFVSPSFPARSGVHMLGQRSEPIADASFEAREKDGRIRSVRVTFRKEVRSLKEVYLVDQTRKGLATLKLRSGNDDKDEWYADIAEEYSPDISASDSQIFGVEVLLRSIGDNGFSAEVMEVEKIAITIQNLDDGQTYELVDQGPFPKHQTAMGKITGVENVSGTGGELYPETDVRLASFAFTGTTLSSAFLQIRTLNFTKDASFGVGVKNRYLTSDATAVELPCSVGSDDGLIHCSSIPLSIGDLPDKTRVLHLHGEVTLGGIGADRTIQILLVEPGGVSVDGAVRWSDGSGEFTSVPLERPVAKGPVWTIHE